MLRRVLFHLLPKRKKATFTKTFATGGALEHIEDSRDYKEPLPGLVIVPSEAKYSLRSKGLTKVENQGYYNSCVAHAVTTSMETFCVNNGFTNMLEFSRMHVWNEGRKLSGTYPNNQGMYIRDAWKAIQTPEIGMTIEKLFPYTDANFNQPIGLAAKIFRRWYPKFSYYWIDGTPEQKEVGIKNVIYNHGVPVVFAIPLSQSFFNPPLGEVYKPTDGESVQFYHAMTITGWDDEKNAFEILNSWGTNWGHSGFVLVDKTWFLEKAYSLSYPLKRV